MLLTNAAGEILPQEIILEETGSQPSKVAFRNHIMHRKFVRCVIFLRDLHSFYRRKTSCIFNLMFINLANLNGLTTAQSAQKNY